MGYVTNLRPQFSPVEHSQVIDPLLAESQGPVPCELDVSPELLGQIAPALPLVRARPPKSTLVSERFVAVFYLSHFIAIGACTSIFLLSFFRYGRLYPTPALVLGVVVLSASALTIARIAFFLRGRHRQSSNLCVECACPRTGLFDHQACPECGAASIRAYHIA